MKLSFVLLSGGLLTFLAVFVTYQYGLANYKRGLSDGQTKCISNAAAAASDARKDLEKETDKVRRIDDIDSELVRLGIMRADADR